MSKARFLTRESLALEVSEAILPIAVGIAIQALHAAQDAEKAEGTGVVRSGLSLCIMRPVHDGNLWMHQELVQISVGAVPVGTAQVGKPYADFAREKCRRLCAHPDHLSSWQSRNPDAKQFGGAIRLKLKDGSSLVIAISGLPEHRDETAVVEIGNALELLAPSDIAKIAKESKNPLIAITSGP